MVNPDSLEMLRQFGQLLFRMNKRLNLTALRTEKEIEDQLILQSVRLVGYLPDECARIIDVGSGGGIPGIPIAICCPDIEVQLVDATAKKVKFLNSAATTLKLQNIEAMHGRVEDFGQAPKYREQFDVVTARALAAMPTLVEYTLPFLKPGGLALLPKGPDPHPEIERAAEAIDELGGKVTSVSIDEALSGSLVIISKVKPTPGRYPRRVGIPAKRPIGVSL